MRNLNEDELAQRSQEFRDFYESLEPSDVRDGPQIDMSALLALQELERSEAEDLLIERVESVGGEVIEALAKLKSQRGAAALKEYSGRARGSSAVEAASALWEIEKWPQAQQILTDVLEGRLNYIPESDLHDDPIARAEAAEALGAIPGPRAQSALSRALKDPDGVVRERAQAWLEERRQALVWWKRLFSFWRT